MSQCSNCYSGCTEVTSDKCVKYTGPDIEILGISSGDNLSTITSTITSYLLSIIDGSGIQFTLDPENTCALIETELSGITDISIVDITNALSKVICSLDTRIEALETANTELEGNYTPECIPGIDGTEGTHTVVQAIISHLCSVANDLDALETDLSTNYVLISDINNYIQTYIDDTQTSSKEKDKMVPYTVVEYYGPLTVFDASGAGMGDWSEIYLCNGENGTPDKRGRIAVGTTTGMLGGDFPPETDPLLNGNPSYTIFTTFGSNTVTLTESQLPSHTHSHTLSSDGEHNHTFAYPVSVHDGGGGDDNRLSNENNISSVDINNTNSAGEHTHNLTINSTGGGEAHNNVPPVLACHYIMYIPTT